eukprot:11302509-Ditylum_brightwellii.AAC.2
MKGCIAKQWCQAQEQYITDLPNSLAFDARTWSSKFIKSIWSIFVDTWNARNAHLYMDMANTTNNIINKSRKIAVYDFTVVHKHSPLQHIITDFFHSNSQHIQPTNQDQQHWQDADTIHIPALI